MPVTTLDILNKKDELDRKADAFYKAIEQWYRCDDSGYVFRDPMNVPADYEGSSHRLHQGNSFYVARAYFQILRTKDFKELASFKEVFSTQFLSDAEWTTLVKEKKAPEQTALLPDRFITSFREFAQNYAAFMTMLQEYQASAPDAGEERAMVVRQNASRLLNRLGHDAKDDFVTKAFNQTKEKIERKEIKSRQEQKTTDLNALQLNSMLERVNCFRGASYSIVRVDGMIISKRKNSSEDKMQHLVFNMEYFYRQLPCINLLTEFHASYLKLVCEARSYVSKALTDQMQIDPTSVVMSFFRGKIKGSKDTDSVENTELRHIGKLTLL